MTHEQNAITKNIGVLRAHDLADNSLVDSLIR